MHTERADLVIRDGNLAIIVSEVFNPGVRRPPFRIEPSVLAVLLAPATEIDYQKS